MQLKHARSIRTSQTVLWSATGTAVSVIVDLLESCIVYGCEFTILFEIGG